MGRIQHRTGGGRFRQSTLADIGMGCCETCGVVFTPNMAKAYVGNFIDPAEFRKRQRTCPACLGEGENPPDALRVK